MKILPALLVFCILTVVPAPSLAQEEMLVLGISPASASLCIRAGHLATVEFLVSTNVDIPQTINVSFMGPTWAQAEKTVQMTSTHKLFVNVSVPSWTAEGDYKINMLVCRTPDILLNETMSAESCLFPTIDVNVSKECPEGIVTEQEAGRRNAVQILIPVAVVLACLFAAILLLRKVINVKGAKKR